MQKATNYNQWTFDQFREYIKGDLLEVGCGVGSFTKLIVEQSEFDSLHCIDISAPAVDHIRKINFGRELRIDCMDLMDVEGSYDFVLCMNVMEHVEDHKAFFEKLLGLLRPGGTLFHLVPSHQSLYTNFDSAAGHFRRYSKDMMNQLPLQDNVSIIKQYYFNMVGALGYWAVYKLLKSGNINDTESEIGMFDKYIVPFSRKFLPLEAPFGISLISIYRKNK